MTDSDSFDIRPVPLENAEDLLRDDHVEIPNQVTVVKHGDLPSLSGIPRMVRIVFKIAAQIEWGSLVTILPDGRAFRFQGRKPGLEGVMKINDYAFARKLMSGGSIGFADAYFARQWESPNVERFLEVVSRNGDRLSAFFDGNFFVKLIQRLLHALNRNSRRGSRRNIVAHYDLGNEFYEAWLDRTMTYSAARFSNKTQSLSEAQWNKYRELAERIELNRSHTVLEIGCGWGGFAEYVAREIGCKYVGITISPEQHKYATERIAKEGLSDNVEIRLQDYRDVGGRFDRIASIEMFEAVGMHYWPTYFTKIRENLNPGGLAGLQIITIAERYWEQYRRGSDFIQRYIFPGGMLPTTEILKNQVDRAGLSWQANSAFGHDYADTLREWRARFQKAWPVVEKMGFDERFRIIWRYYLSYCEAGFRSGSIDVSQLVIAKP